MSRFIELYKVSETRFDYHGRILIDASRIISAHPRDEGTWIKMEDSAFAVSQSYEIVKAILASEHV